MGTRDLYDGELGAEVGRATDAAGGLLSAADLAGYAPRWEPPPWIRYRGLDVCTTPPNSQGVTALMMLAALQELRADKLHPGSAEHLEAFIAAKRCAFADRDRYVADPDFVQVPVDELLHSGYAREALALPAAVARGRGHRVLLRGGRRGQRLLGHPEHLLRLRIMLRGR